MPQPFTIEAAVLGDLERELGATRRVLAVLPDDAWTFRPKAGAWCLGDLANHLLELVFWAQTVLDRDVFDAEASEGEAPSVASNHEDALRTFDKLVARVRAAAQSAHADVLGAPWALAEGSQVILTMRRADALRQNCLNHLVHHRGQLVLYLRLLGFPAPQLYEG